VVLKYLLVSTQPSDTLATPIATNKKVLSQIGSSPIIAILMEHLRPTLPHKDCSVVNVLLAKARMWETWGINKEVPYILRSGLSA